MAASRLAIAMAFVGVVATLAGLLTMTGHLRRIITPSLSAEVHLTDYLLPAGFGVDPQEVADFLAQEMVTRTQNDIAVRLALGEQAQRRLIEVGIPRLVSTSVVRDMIKGIPPLAKVLSVADFRIAAQIVVRNQGEARPDVALTLPGAILAEAETGSAGIEETSTGLTAVVLGDMAAGETRVLRVWLGQAAVDAGPGLAASVRLGDGNGDSGRVWLFDRGAWRGADLQAVPWARWLVAGVLLTVLVGSGLVLGFALLSARGRRTGRVSRA